MLNEYPDGELSHPALSGTRPRWASMRNPSVAPRAARLSARGGDRRDGRGAAAWRLRRLKKHAPTQECGYRDWHSLFAEELSE